MVSYKLLYFPVYGRAEHIRFMFAYADVAFEDQRIHKSVWSEWKPKMPMGQMPVLEVDGKQICQSMTIARYLAFQFGLAGKDHFEQALADMYVDGVLDLNNTYIRHVNFSVWNDVGDKWKEHYNKLKTEGLPPFLDRYEKFLAENNTGFLVGNKLTWADIVVGEILGRIMDIWDADVLIDHPRLLALKETVYQQPGIKKYLAVRHKTRA